MNMTLFYSFWWLIFPVGWMILRAFNMFGHYNHRNEVLKLLKTYADQGKEPPATLLETLRHDETRDVDDRDHWRDRRWRNRGYRGRFGSFVVFAALAAGFGYAGYTGLEPSVFNALALAFAVASGLMLVLGIIDYITRPKL